MERSQVKWLYISIGFSLLVLVIILFLTINENTIKYIREINPLFLLLAFLTHIMTMCFWAWRVQKMSGSLGYRIGFFYCLNLVFANLLAAAITPAQAGGEPVAEAAHCRVDPRSILEALLFVGLPGGEPLSSRRVARLMRGVRAAEIDELAAELGSEYTANGCPYEIISNASGWLLRLRDEYRQLGVLLEAKTRRVRLDAAALDALAVVAWNQPVAKSRFAELGCDASPAVLRQLVRRGLLELAKPSGDAADGSGVEPTYRTTKKFLDVFQLRNLDDLPDPREPPR